jgi:hypothetical protein
MKIEDVDDKHTFLAFIGELRSELADPIHFSRWENATLHDFLGLCRLGRPMLLIPPPTLGSLRRR